MKTSSSTSSRTTRSKICCFAWGRQPQLFRNFARTGILRRRVWRSYSRPDPRGRQPCVHGCTGPFTRRTTTAYSARALFPRLETYSRRTPTITVFHSLLLSGAATWATMFRKGGVRNVNASLARTWKVSGEKSLTLRVESINFFNTPQFAAPGNELASSNFGQIRTP